MRARLTLALALALLAGCRGGPTLDEARDLLRSGDPHAALDVARRASARVGPEERLAARRLALQAALQAALPREAAREYQLLRRLTGRDDEGLMAEVAGAALRRAATGSDPARRIRAVEAVRVLGEDARALALLRMAAVDPRPEVRAAVVGEVARRPDRAEAQRQLVSAARADASPYVRRRALEELARALAGGGAGPGAPAARAADGIDVGALAREALEDEDEDVRAAAVGLLRHALPADEAARALHDELRRKPTSGRPVSDHVRCVAALELLRLDPAAARRAWSQADLPVAGSVADAEEAPLSALGLALQAHGQPDRGVTAAVADVLAGARDYRARLLAARGLAGPGARLLASELEAALKDAVQPVRVAALDALVAGAGPRAERACRRALRHEDAATRQRALHGLLALRELDADDVVALLDDAALATDAAQWLAAHGGERGFQALVESLDGGAASTTALEVLAERGDRRLRERFLDLLGAPPERAAPEVRRAAAIGLARCGQAPDRALLLAMVERGTDDTDLTAASAILSIQTRLSLTGAAPGVPPQ